MGCGSVRLGGSPEMLESAAAAISDTRGGFALQRIQVELRFTRATELEPAAPGSAWREAAGKDELGRELEAEGRPHNKMGVHLNPNLWTWNCLTDWQWDSGKRGWGEDHDNWSASAFRQFVRSGEA